MTKFRKCIAAAAVALAFSAPVRAENWDIATAYPDSTFHTINIRQFADEVSAATDDAVKFTVHSAGSLFPAREIKNAVRSGQIPMGEFLLSLHANESRSPEIDSLPFLVTSYEDAGKLWAAQRESLTELLDRQGMMPLFSVPWPAQGLYTNGELARVEDLAGVRFRAYGPIFERFVALANASPVQVDPANIAQAFLTGQATAMLTSPSTGADSKAWDYVSHFTEVNAFIPKNIVVVNKRAFARLPENVQAAVLEAAARAEARGWAMSEKEAAEKIAVMADNGMTIVKPSAELMDGLNKIGTQMLEEWTAGADEDTRAILDEFRGQ